MRYNDIREGSGGLVIWKRIFTPQTIDEQPNNTGIPVAGEPESEEDTSVETAPKEEMPSSVLELTVRVRLDDENQVGRAALLLAATTTEESENSFRRDLARWNWRSVATEVGGLAGDLPQKITRALVGASLNAGVVEKKRNEMHALMHAAVEALDGFLAVGMLEASIGAKISIVRNSRWIAVAVMGDTAYHAVAHHERCGLGVMHI